MRISNSGYSGGTPPSIWSARCAPGGRHALALGLAVPTGSTGSRLLSWFIRDRTSGAQSVALAFTNRNGLAIKSYINVEVSGVAMNAVTDLDMLNGAEKKLVKAAEHDTVADLRRRENGERPVIRARLLRELCTGHRQWDVKDRIRMSGGRVEG